MKLFRFSQPDHEKPAVLVDGRRLDVSEFGEDYNEPFSAADGVARLQKLLLRRGIACPVVDKDERVAPCVPRPSKIVCAGLNYHQHAIESGMEIPKSVLFLKAATALAGPNDDVVIPPG